MGLPDPLQNTLLQLPWTHTWDVVDGDPSWVLRAFTGTFSGGSMLPFILFRSETYTVQMTSGYNGLTFSHWQADNSQDPTGSIFLGGNATFVAVS